MFDWKSNVYPVLLAGGTGTRLWPVSRELYPKQLVKFIGKDSLVQSTIKRFTSILDIEKIRIVCGKKYFHETARHMSAIGIQPEGKIICEPSGRNTAPAVLLAILNILKIEKDAILCIFPADHVIKDIESFHEKLKTAIKLADKGYIVTFGIKPNYPETGYGYIEGAKEVSNGALAVKRFVEKPDKETAERYVNAGNFFWNSGMFTFKASVMIEEFKAYQPELFKRMDEIVSKNDSITKTEYDQLPDLSIDYAIMEKTDKVVVLPSDFGWSDIGSWKSLYDFLPKDKNCNVIDGDVVAKDTKNCFIMGRERLIATNCINDIVIVDTPDSVFVSDIDNSRDVKCIVAKLKEKGRKEYHQHKTMHYSWGSFTLLEQKENFKTARLIIYPGSTFQIEIDTAATKHLIVLKGAARVVMDNKTKILSKSESTVISHKSQNKCSEKSIVKLENSGNEPLCIVCVDVYK